MKSKLIYIKAEADEIISLINEKLKADNHKQKGIRAKIRKKGFYASEFGFRDGYTVANFLSVITITKGNFSTTIKSNLKKKPTLNPTKSIVKGTLSRNHSDETYVIDLCDEVIKQKAIRQHRFDFLTGDTGTKLPVDAYYPTLKLVIEFRERQHTEAVNFFDKRQTVSGMGRGEQRRLYDRRRREVLPKYGITLIEIGYDDFEHNRNKKLVRDKENDLKVIIKKMKK